MQDRRPTLPNAEKTHKHCIEAAMTLQFCAVEERREMTIRVGGTEYWR